MAIEALLARYGLIAVFLGAGLEGEATVIAGGILAHRHLIPFWPTALAAALGSMLVDQTWFLLARRHRTHGKPLAIERGPAFARACAALARHPRAFIFSFRFIYGLRNIGAVAVGISDVPARLFVPINALAAAIWSLIFTTIGYQFGSTLKAWSIEARRGEDLLIGLAVLVAAILLVREAVRHRAFRRLSGPMPDPISDAAAAPVDQAGKQADQHIGVDRL